MAITVSGRKMNVTPAIKDYVDEKIGRALEVFDSAAMDAEVVLRTRRIPRFRSTPSARSRSTPRAPVIRVAESAEDMYAAIDLASDKVARQLRKYKTRIVERRGGRGSIRHLQPDELDIPDVIPTEPEEDDDLLVRLKEVEMEPMTEEHALVQTDLLGHDFFVYFDQDAHQIQVIYHRKNGGYGIIKPIINA